MYWRQVALHRHHPPPQLEISYKNCKVNALFRSGWLLLCGKPIGNKLHYIKRPCHDNLPAATQLWEGGEGRGSYFVVVTGESETKLGGQKWGCWHSLLEIKEGGQVRFLLSLPLSDGLVLQVQDVWKYNSNYSLKYYLFKNILK